MCSRCTVWYVAADISAPAAPDGSWSALPGPCTVRDADALGALWGYTVHGHAPILEHGCCRLDGEPRRAIVWPVLQALARPPI